MHVHWSRERVSGDREEVWGAQQSVSSLAGTWVLRVDGASRALVWG